ncbi:MAG: hypothetical protein KAS86_04250, partial [Candidatus Omnitrophica bacterium]|nr:hypothetical protein [Candidatus Omnitrophota bacterium]
LFFMNTIAGALPQRIFPVSRTVLQVQSMFKPILDVTGKEYETQLRIETAFILAMILRDDINSFQDINAALDDWYSALTGRGKKRVLRVISNPARKDGSVTVNLELFRGSWKGKKFRITSACKSIADIQADGNRVKIERVFDDRSSARIKDPGMTRTMIADDDLYVLKEDAARGVEEVISQKASSIVVDGETGERRYFKNGDPLIPIQADVYMKEGESWDLPAGIEFPLHLDRIMKRKEGALLLTTGPFYVRKEGARSDRYIRPLNDREVYERFGLRRVYGKDGQPFQIPALGLRGRSMMLPVSYDIATVKNGEGIRIVRDKKGYQDRTLERRAVFGLEFKAAGVSSYTRHNLSADFPSTTFDEHAGKPGIFLDWWYQISRRTPVGLGTLDVSSMSRESSLLAKGADLTRWTLGTLQIDQYRGVSLRVPVGDYRRLSVFFDRRGMPDRDIFNAVIRESGLSIDGFLLELSRNYGKNMRIILETGISENERGSIIDSDIFGRSTDFGDFYEISGSSEDFFRGSVHDWVDNL